MEKVILVFLGGGVGAVARYGVGLGFGRAGLSGWPYATLAINVVGGLLMGVLVTWLALRGDGDQDRWRAILGVGVLGGFTTFSAFSLETALMIERRQLFSAGTYVVLSVVLSIAAVLLGMMLTRRVFA